MLTVLKKIITFPLRGTSNVFHGRLGFLRSVPDIVTKVLSAFFIYGLMVVLLISMVQAVLYLFGMDQRLFGPKGDEISVRVAGEQAMISPNRYYMDAGQRIEIRIPRDQGFFVDGDYKGEALPPFTNRAYIRFSTPSGDNYRLADWRTSFRARSTGELKFTIEHEKGTRIWSGRRLKAERLSQFKRCDISIFIKKVDIFTPNAARAKRIKREKDLEEYLVFKEDLFQRLRKETKEYWLHDPDGRYTRENIDNLEQILQKAKGRTARSIKGIPEKVDEFYDKAFNRKITD
jgi:hypothetical protein